MQVWWSMCTNSCSLLLLLTADRVLRTHPARACKERDWTDCGERKGQRKQNSIKPASEHSRAQKARAWVGCLLPTMLAVHRLPAWQKRLQSAQVTDQSTKVSPCLLSMFSITWTSEGGSIALTATTVTRQCDLVRFSQESRATKKKILYRRHSSNILNKAPTKAY